MKWTLMMFPLVSGLYSSPVSPLIFGYFFFSERSMWSNERFSITNTTICLRLSRPFDMIPPQFRSDDSALYLRKL